MSEVGHTKGPWFVSGPFVGPRLNPESGILIKVARVAGVETDEESIANARLIAAAPELLSIVKRFVALPSGAWHPERHAAEEAELVRDARAAIARAEGR
jgi:hypothetical protein